MNADHESDGSDATGSGHPRLLLTGPIGHAQSRAHVRCIVAEVNPVPVAVRRTAKFMIAATQKLDPSRLALPNSQLDRGSVALVAVYRRKHLGRMRRLLAQLHQDVTVRLWCLDEPPDTLRHLTLGHGPGVRFKLLNDLINTIPAAKRRDGLVLSDDDYSFRVGTLPQLVTAGQALRLDMWQPAHDRSSFASFPFVRRQTATVLRRTTFVEQGPVLVLSARAQELLLPLPEDLGMAWGVEVRWAEIVKKYGLRLGIVDALAIHHLPPAGAYDRSVQRDQLQLLLRDAGLPSIEHMQQELARVRPLEGRRLLRS